MKAKRFLELNVSVASEWAETIDGGARINRKQWNCFSSIGYLASNPSYFVLLVWIHFHMCYKLAAIKMDLICFPVLAIPVMPQAYRMSASENSCFLMTERKKEKDISELKAKFWSSRLSHFLHKQSREAGFPMQGLMCAMALNFGN